MSSITTTYLITGASSGIGLELTKQLATTKNTKVFATVRKKGSSQTGVDEISAIKPVDGSSITILEGIDVSDDNVGNVLLPQLEGEVIDVVIHNAGSLNGTRDIDGANAMGEQKLGSVTMDRMRAAFEVNTLGPLRVQKALSDANLMRTNTTNDGMIGKVAIISTGFASIGDNTSGGTVAYRTSKAAVNMIAKCMSCDFKKEGISVMAIAPGFVATDFGPGKERMMGWGAMPVETSGKGIISILESMSMENTGEFWGVQKDGSSKVLEW